MATASIGVAEVRSDLLDEQQALDEIVADLAPERWAEPTPSPRWTVTRSASRRGGSASEGANSSRRRDSAIVIAPCCTGFWVRASTVEWMWRATWLRFISF